MPHPFLAHRAGKSIRLVVLILAAGPLFCGCKQISKLTGPDKKYDLLEAELRTRERELLEARQELSHTRQLGDIYSRAPGPTFGPMIDPHIGTPVGHAPPMGGCTLREVLLGNGTGGRDDDGSPGDELLQVVIVPKDDDGTAVKVPVRASVCALEITREGQKIPIGKWEITPEQMRRTWRSGLIGSGFFVPLAWDRPPTTDRVRVVVRVVTPDGREFEADRDVRVMPLPGLNRATPLPSGPDTFPSSPYPATPYPASPFPAGMGDFPPPRSIAPPPTAAPSVLPPPTLLDPPARILPANPQ